jgi:hypothetical protein
MALTLRLVKGSALSYAEGDGNFTYLFTNMSGSNISITGSTGIKGNTVITGSLDVNGTVRATSTIFANNITGVVFNTASVGDVKLRGDNVGSGLDGGDYILKTNIAYYGNVMTDSALPYLGFTSGSGTSNFIAKYKGLIGNPSTTLGNSLIYDNGTNVGINTTSPSYNLDVSGSTRISDVLILPPQSPLPSGKPTGSFAVSGSGADCKPYFYNGTSWTALF